MIRCRRHHGRVARGSSHEHPVDPKRVAAARRQLVAPDEADDLAELFRVLGDPVRARIISALSGGGELCVGDVALAIDASENSVSYALGVLRRAGLVERQRRGRAIYYRIADPRLPELVELARGTPT
jgi:ArsR family transcriptional regulator, lead/cadmium/zinc/bismuth-responsive transcriptional repressor